jgi:hypothetical protein
MTDAEREQGMVPPIAGIVNIFSSSSCITGSSVQGFDSILLVQVESGRFPQ